MKRLYRSRRNRMLGGVCAGIAEYFNVDPVLIRGIAILFFFAGGSAIIAYIVGLIIIPNEPLPAPVAADGTSATPPAPANVGSDSLPLIFGVIMIILGALFLLHNIPIFDHYYWWFRHHIWRIFWPSLLIIFGVFIIARGTQKNQN
jgi:phage shock protein C